MVTGLRYFYCSLIFQLLYSYYLDWLFIFSCLFLPTVAGSILSKIDRSVNPCEDFYSFSCGGWLKENPIPEDSSSYGIYPWLRQHVDIRLKGMFALKFPINAWLHQRWWELEPHEDTHKKELRHEIFCKRIFNRGHKRQGQRHFLFWNCLGLLNTIAWQDIAVVHWPLMLLSLTVCQGLCCYWNKK